MSAVHAMASQRKHDNNGRGGTETKCCGHRHARAIARNTKKKRRGKRKTKKKRSCENRIMVSVTEPFYRYLMSVVRVACRHHHQCVVSSLHFHIFNLLPAPDSIISSNSLVLVIFLTNINCNTLLPLLNKWF